MADILYCSISRVTVIADFIDISVIAKPSGISFNVYCLKKADLTLLVKRK